MKTPWIALLEMMFLFGFAQSAQSGAILGTVTGSSVSAGPLAADPLNRDDWNYASTIPITFVSTMTPIFNAAVANWGGAALNFAVAGDPNDPIGKAFTPIDPSDFNIKAYTPWVVNSNQTTNFVTGNDGVKYDRGVTNQDAGGANIVIQYTPTNQTDPTKFNFLQVITTSYYTPNPELGSYLPGYTRFDNGGSTTPYYNEQGVGGVGNTANNTTPLDATRSSGWLLDIPYRCESGFNTGVNAGSGCPATTPATDGLINTITSTFDTYIEADYTPINGPTYQVLYGAVEWGYTYTNSDVPEPSTLVLLTVSLLGLWCAGRRNPRQYA